MKYSENFNIIVDYYMTKLICTSYERFNREISIHRLTVTTFCYHVDDKIGTIDYLLGYHGICSPINPTISEKQILIIFHDLLVEICSYYDIEMEISRDIYVTYIDDIPKWMKLDYNKLKLKYG